MTEVEACAAQNWTVEISDEIAAWYGTLKDKDRAYADAALNRLRDRGPQLCMPHSRPLDAGLWELRFMCENVARRITYYFDGERKVITLTTFRKQRQKEKTELTRARRAMKASREARGS
ncbi:MAG: type II toxin-antitoxin system RelE/ParE family toxin [Actinobacteria bacterium]|nr:type II toxin-antitoxin system RelE/ParE family toxin [Actinomycetota bacterium]